jgi:acetyl esterase/lipase
MTYLKVNIVHILLVILFLGYFGRNGYSQTDTILDEIEIWPGAGPGSEALSITETVIVRSLTGTCTRDWAITKVTVPTITPLIPTNPTGSAFIICPGGAYQRVVYDVEGMDVGRWLNTLGITAFVLKYRLPADEHLDKKNVPLQDAQRAVRYVKMHAEEWGLDTSKIGIAGASAGGHAAAMLAVDFNKVTYEAKDTIDSISSRPYYMFLLYPVVSMETSITHIGTRDMLLGTSPSQELIDEFSAEKHVSPDCPKTFIAFASDDSGVNPENSKRLYRALRDSGVVARLNIYINGGHGVGICKAVGKDFANWPNDCADWLDSLGLGIKPEISDYTDAAVDSRDPFYVLPNPAAQNATIHFTVNDDAFIRISLFDLTGRQVMNLLNEKKVPGNYCISIDEFAAENNGIFILRFENGTSCKAMKAIFLPD